MCLLVARPATLNKIVMNIQDVLAQRKWVPFKIDNSSIRRLLGEQL